MASEHLIKITNKAKQLRRANPKLKWTEAVKKASKLVKPMAKKAAKKKPHTKWKVIPKHERRVSGKVTKKPVTKTHKDTKSHNVNIRVVSGVKNTFWIETFAPRSRAWQNATYQEIKKQVVSNYSNPFESKAKLLEQLRALEYILNKKPLIIK